MNFLAHLVLAPQTPDGLLGSIAPDLIRGPLPSNLPAEVMQAALEHQCIDRFTDTHRCFYATRERLRSIVNPRLAGVLADVVYDHVLACGWADYRDDTLAGFIGHAHPALQSGIHAMPTDMCHAVGLMIEQRWLASYQTMPGLRDRLGQMSARLSRRLGREMSLVPAAGDLERVLPDVADDFDMLWPALCQFVAEHRRNTRPRLAS